jgi:hypothetical protein
MKKILSFTLLALLGYIKAAPAEDLVPYLPLMTNFSFNMYSGYLPVTGTDRSLHYILAESQNDPKNDIL